MCNSEDPKPVYLEKEKFDEIKIKLGKELINFDTSKNKWNPYIKDSIQISTNIKKSKNEHNQEDIEKLKKENEEKDKKISDLESKINGVKKKIETLKNILKVDVGEQLYLDDLLQEKKNKENNDNKNDY